MCANFVFPLSLTTCVGGASAYREDYPNLHESADQGDIAADLHGWEDARWSGDHKVSENMAMSGSNSWCIPLHYISHVDDTPS